MSGFFVSANSIAAHLMRMCNFETAKNFEI